MKFKGKNAASAWSPSKKKAFSASVERFRKPFLESGLSEKDTEKILNLIGQQIGLLNEFQEIDFKVSFDWGKNDIYAAFGKALIERGGLTPALKILDEIAEYADEKPDFKLRELLYLHLAYGDHGDAADLFDRLKGILGDAVQEPLEEHAKGVEIFNHVSAVEEELRNLEHRVGDSCGMRDQSSEMSKKNDKASKTKGGRIADNVNRVNRIEEEKSKMEKGKKQPQPQRGFSPEVMEEGNEGTDEDKAV